MNTLRWVKLRTDLFSDPDVRLLLTQPDGRDCVLVLQLLMTLAGRSNDHGRIWRREGQPYTTAHLAAMLYADEALVDACLSSLEDTGLIETANGVLTLPAWDEEQVAGLEEELIRSATRDRVRKHRERGKSPEEATEDNACNVEDVPCNTNSVPCNAEDVTCNAEPVTCNAEDVTCNTNDVTCNADVTPIEIEREIEKETETSTGEKRARFAPPSLDEVRAYCRQRGNRVNADHFVDYYTSNGWLVGKNHMRDWKAAVRAWENNGITRASPGKTYGRQALPPGTVLGPSGIPILPKSENDLDGIL